jgi:hypothetical protein
LLTSLPCSPKQKFSDEMLCGIAFGICGCEHLHLINHLLVGEILIEPVRRQHQKLVFRTDPVVAQ